MTTRFIQQQYTGAILEVVKEDDNWLSLTNPKYPGSAFMISRYHYDLKWKPYKEGRSLSKSEAPELDNNEDAEPPKRQRGRPAGSKNKPKA